MMTAFLSGWEIWVVLIVALLLFGHRIPGMARSLGSGIVEFKKGLSGDAGKDEQIPPPPVAPPSNSGQDNQGNS